MLYSLRVSPPPPSKENAGCACGLRCDTLLVSEPLYYTKAYVVRGSIEPHIPALGATVMAHFTIPCFVVHRRALQMALTGSHLLTDRVTSCYILVSSSVLLTRCPSFAATDWAWFKILQQRYSLLLTLGLPTSYVGETQIIFQWNGIWWSGSASLPQNRTTVCT
jgi:hypothetical protein